MRALQARLSEAVEVARAQTSSGDPLKLAIIAGLILADDASRAEEAAAARAEAAPSGGAPDRGLEEAERIALKLISDIDERLGG